MATVTIEPGLTWEPLMETIGYQLLVGFGRFQNVAQLEEALYISIEDNGPLEIVHLGPLGLTEAQLDLYLGVLADVAKEEPLTWRFV